MAIVRLQPAERDEVVKRAVLTHVAEIELPRDVVSQLKFANYVDELDEYSAAYFKVGQAGVVLQRYRATPVGRCTLLVDLAASARQGVDADRLVDALLRQWLRVGDRAILWRAELSSSGHAEESIRVAGHATHRRYAEA